MDKMNGEAKPTGCTSVLIAAVVIVAFIGLVMIAIYLSSLAGIR